MNMYGPSNEAIDDPTREANQVMNPFRSDHGICDRIETSSPRVTVPAVGPTSSTVRSAAHGPEREFEQDPEKTVHRQFHNTSPYASKSHRTGGGSHFLARRQLISATPHRKIFSAPGVQSNG